MIQMAGFQNDAFQQDVFQMFLFDLTGYVPISGGDGSILEPTRETLKRRRR